MANIADSVPSILSFVGYDESFYISILLTEIKFVRSRIYGLRKTFMGHVHNTLIVSFKKI